MEWYASYPVLPWVGIILFGYLLGPLYARGASAETRQHRLLAMEIQKRYRRLMRVLHPDSLGRLLAPEQLAGLGDTAVWPEMMAVAAAAKRFIERRRDLSQQVEEWVAAELGFVREIRRRRHQHLCGMEFSESPAARA